MHSTEQPMTPAEREKLLKTQVPPSRQLDNIALWITAVSRESLHGMTPEALQAAALEAIGEYSDQPLDLLSEAGALHAMGDSPALIATYAAAARNRITATIAAGLTTMANPDFARYFHECQDGERSNWEKVIAWSELMRRYAAIIGENTLEALRGDCVTADDSDALTLAALIALEK